MKIVGLTGGIGSGKTTVAKMFENLGAALFIADQEAKKLLNTDVTVISKVKALLGDPAYISNEEGVPTADRAYIASQVFKDKKLLKELNAIIHPALRTYFENWKTNVKAPYILYEAAILLETGGHKICDQVVLVYASEDKRIKRVMQRDGVDEVAVRERLSNQWNDLQRLSLSEYVIINEDLQKTESIVGYIHEVLLN